MSGKKIWWILIFLFLAGTTSGLFLEFFFTGERKQELDVSQLEKVIQKRQVYLNELLKNFPDSILKTPSQTWAAMDSISETGNDLLVFKNNKLVAWSDQGLPLQDVHPVFLSQPFIKLDNGCYLVQQMRQNDFLLVGMYKIKQSFPYQNKYLKDRFLLPLALAPSVDIVRNQNSFYKPVYGLEGEYLFSVSNLMRRQKTNSAGIYVFWAYLLSVLALWGIILMWLKQSRGHRFQNIRLLLAIGVFSVYFYFAFWHSGLSAFQDLGLFSPLHFAMSDLFSSLGALLLFAIFILLISFFIFRFFRWPVFLNGNKDRPFSTAALFLLFFSGVQIWMLYLMRLIYKLVEHSSGPSVFFKVIEIDEIAVTKIFILALLFFSFILIIEKVIRLFIFRISRAQLCLLIAGSTILIALLWGGLGYGSSDWSILFAGLVGLLLAMVKRDFRLHHSYNTFLWLVSLIALFSGTVLIDRTIQKEEENRSLLVENLSYQLLREEDPVAEMYLNDIERQILQDAPLRQLLAQTNINQSAVRNHLLKYYFYGYWGRYDMQIVPCWPGGNVVFEETGEAYNCYQYFFSIVHKEGNLIDGNNHFYYLNNDNGRVSYLGAFRFFEGHPLETTLFIELQSKPYFEGLGYPELLISQKEQARLGLFNDYSYAKYVDGHLVKRSGEYDYHGTFRQMQFSEESKMYMKEGGYSHLVFSPEPDTVVILSREDHSVSDIFIAFSVFFIFFFITGLLLVGLTQAQSLSFTFKLSVQKRIQLSFVGLMLFILLVVAIGTILYTVNQFKNKHEELLNDKVQSVLLELESKIGLEGSLNEGNEKYLNYQLQTISNVFFCDINLFSKDGSLLASSRPELFDQGLIGSQMNPSAYYELVFNGASRFLGDERVGRLEYTSYYVPFYSRDDVLLGYVNVPYFVANNELREEVSSVVMTVVNFYLLFSFIVIGIGVFLSRQITRPLQVLQSKLSELKIDRHNEKIDYQGEDEIGSLVGEYNRMVDELSESASKLARTERELAWREMARQIAHEIKNPLTPMKLNIQYLQRAWKDKVPDFDAFLERVTGTLIEQIEKLSSIATEFSHFAKMPAAKRENIDLIEKVRSSVTLFSKVDEVEIVTDFGKHESLIVNADGEQMLGVFNNLINNAVQAIPKDRTGRIKISGSVEGGSVLVKIRDNGKGIPEEVREKMFVPNFTTKTSGMGLGLAIVKGIIESAGGEIWFETQQGEGSTFFIQLPLSSQS
ncbi:sensor histidine kinase [Marinilabilia rubra]|uniref:histidine kinase n=1 Tax=Marinilabilia rubra TaxID=2162893 RepID=A0A2U2B4G0_9BACT|nr:ATP-binding protein [Marinilabilia rubra]PWD97948.1 sensor histidine kinase [Marinilabilia rubra]